MSTGGLIEIPIVFIALLIRSIIELSLEYKEMKQMRTADGKVHNVDVLVKDEFGKDVGFIKNKKGSYEIITDTSGLSGEQINKQKDFVKKIRQRYSYNSVIAELKKKGYIIAEEEKVQNNTIRLVARKWA